MNEEREGLNSELNESHEEREGLNEESRGEAGLNIELNEGSVLNWDIYVYENTAFKEKMYMHTHLVTCALLNLSLWFD